MWTWIGLFILFLSLVVLIVFMCKPLIDEHNRWLECQNLSNKLWCMLMDSDDVYDKTNYYEIKYNIKYVWSIDKVKEEIKKREKKNGP